MACIKKLLHLRQETLTKDPIPCFDTRNKSFPLIPLPFPTLPFHKHSFISKFVPYFYTHFFFSLLRVTFQKMAHAPVLPCQNLSPKIFYSTQASLINNANPPTSTKINLIRVRGIAVLKESIPRTKNRRKPKFVVALAANSGSASTETSMSDAVKKLYTCINEKDLKQLENLVSNDCIVEDSAFPYKFKQKREVVSFFTQLVESMGKNVQFRIGTVCEGDELTASVHWHLEWEEDQIPFSRGCSIFQFSNEEDKLVIRKAQIITESPIKPGKLATAFLKMLTSLFDDFPKAAKWFLKSPNTILKAVLTIYNLFVAPLVHPVFTCYLNLWKFTVRALGYIIGILHFVAKRFNQKSSSDDPDSTSSITE